MKIPGFTAEACLDDSPRNYAMANSARIAGGVSVIMPQQGFVSRGVTPDTCYCCSADDCWEASCFSTCGFGKFIKWRCNETKCWKPAAGRIPLTS